MKIRKILIFISSILLIIGCSSSENLPNGEDDNNKVTAKFKVASYNIRNPAKADVPTGNGC